MQDQGKRLLLAVSLALGVMLVWQLVFPSKSEDKPPPATTGSGSGAAVVSPSQALPPPGVGAPTVTQPATPTTAPTADSGEPASPALQAEAVDRKSVV